jgi:hypothetical protein
MSSSKAEFFRHDVMAWTVVEAGEHLHPTLIFRLPLAGVIGGFLVGANAVRRRRPLALGPAIDAERGHAERFPILQPDRVDQGQRVDLARVHQRVARRDHAAGGVSQHNGALDAYRSEQGVGVGGQLLETILIPRGLAGFAEPNLIRRDDAIAGAGEGADGLFPGRGAKILAMQRHHHAPVRRRGLHVHEAHCQRLALRDERVVVNRPGVVEPLQFRAKRGRVGARGSRGGEKRRACDKA